MIRERNLHGLLYKLILISRLIAKGWFRSFTAINNFKLPPPEMVIGGAF